MHWPPELSFCQGAAQCSYREQPTLRGILTAESLLPLKRSKADEHGGICSKIKTVLVTHLYHLP